MEEKNRTYIAIDLKSFYASAECVERGLDPLDTNLVVADESRTSKTICLAVSPSLKSFGIPGRPRLFVVEQAVKKLNEHGITQIWVDYEKIKSGTYWQKIIDGIRDSAYFIPIVTEHFIDKTKGFTEQTSALKRANLESITFEAEDARNLNDYLDGVQVELLLASKHFKDTYPSPNSTYSLPILQKDCTWHDFPVDVAQVEELGQRQRLPKDLFRGKQIKEIDFDEEDLKSLDLDWDTFKSEKELSNEHE